MNAKELVKVFFEDVFTDGDLQRCDEIAATMYAEHAIAPFGNEEPGVVPGPEHLKAAAQWLREQYPDVTMRVEQVVVEGDTVAVLVESQGTNLGRLNGVLPPTGRTFHSRQSHWFRVEDGRLAEHWATREDLLTMIQLGVIHRPGPPG